MSIRVAADSYRYVPVRAELAMHRNLCKMREKSPLSIGGCAVRAAGILLSLLLTALLAPANATDTSNELPVKLFIIGGQPVERNTYPWIVALTYAMDAELVQRQFCAGSVIADRWVMTAAHCLYDNYGAEIATDAFKVAINATNLSDEDVPELDIANTIIHPAYDHAGKNPHSDIALIELAQSSGITPMTLSTKATDRLIGLQATAIGWGAIDNTNPIAPQFPVWLHSVDVPVVSMNVCNAPESYAGNIYPNQLCAGYAEGGRDSCVGDSGGPLLATYEGVVQQVGVVSFGYGCALPNFYGIYTDVPYFIGWINQYVYVGEPEFEPELFEVKGSTTAIRGGGSGTNSSTGGASSVFVILALFSGIVIRRRLC